MRSKFGRFAVCGTLLIALGVSLANSAEADSWADTCSEKLTAHCAPLAAACAQMKTCLTKASGIRACVTRGVPDLDALRSCTPCRGPLAELEKQSAACKKPAKPKATTPASATPPPSAPVTAPAPPAPPAPPPSVGSPGVVPGIPADCKANLPQSDLGGLVADSNWGYCDANALDCPCSYKPCTIGMDYVYANVLEPSFPDAENPGWSKTKVKNGPGMAEWMYCTVRSCQISATNTNKDATALRCWSKPLP